MAHKRQTEASYQLLPLHSDALPTTARRSYKLYLRPLFLVLIATCTIVYVLHSATYPHVKQQPSICGSPSSCSRNPAYLVKARHGAVASENQLCSQIGVNTLKQGGNAVDAAVSTTLCIGVVNMFSSGIGGGGFMTIRIPPSNNSSSEVYTIDFRETAPASAHERMYVEDPSLARWGGLSVGVPGELKGLKLAHDRWGIRSWSELVEPSMKLARGWKVSKELARRINMFASLMHNDPDWKEIFAPNGCLLNEGDTIRRTALARTLATISAEGPKAFYIGPIADAILAKIRATGGNMTQEDLDNYSPKLQRALEGTFRGRKVYTTHAPTSGPAFLHMLNLLERYEHFREEGRTAVNVHRITEIMKFGFAARTKLGDPDFLEGAEAKGIDEIPTKEFAAMVFPNITDDRTHQPAYYNPVYDVPIDHGTSHSSIVDKNGMAVGVTSTVNLVFGSAVLDPVTGVILNDEMDDFSIPGVPNAFGLWPSPYNYPQPGKRPLSSIVPTILEDEFGDLLTVVGASGGSKIFPAVFQVLANLDWDMDVSAAIEHGRVHNQLFPLSVEVDNVYPPQFVDGLKERGHNITVADIGRVAAVVQAVTKRDGFLYAASDSRKRGRAAGY